MSRIVTRIVAAGMGGLLLASAPAAAGALPATPPPAQISALQTTPGKAEFVFSARDLPAGAHLDPRSIRVTADGRPIHATATPAASRSDAGALPEQAAMLVVDLSGSMAGAGIAAVRQAAAKYAQVLPPSVRVGLVTFATKPTVVLAPTTDHRAVTAALARAQPAGDTALYDGIAAAVQALAALPASADRRLVVLADGDDNASRLKLPGVLTALNRARMPADVVAFRLGTTRAAQQQIAAASGGRLLPAVDAAQLATAFAAAASTFTERASVTVEVPKRLAGKRATIIASMTAGRRTMTSTASVQFAGVALPAAARPTTKSETSAAETTQPDPVLWLVLGITFLALLSVFWLAFHRPKRGNRTKERLAAVQRYQLLDSPQPTPSDSAVESVLSRAALQVVDKAVRARGTRERIAGRLDRAGVRLRPQEWVLLQLSACVVAAACLTFVTGSLLLGAPIGALVGWLATRVYLGVKTSRRARAFADQLPDLLQIVAGSLRSGFSLNQALDGVVREGSEPGASEFARALAEARLGASLEDALDGVADRMRCRDLSWVVMAVRISREVGGNLAEVVLTTVATMRERAQMRRQVRALSAEGRLSAWILIGLPIAIGSWLLLVRRDYLRPLFSTPIGIVMLATAGVLIVVGALWMSRLVKVEV